MPNSSTATIASCAFCASGSAGSSATSGAGSQATGRSRRHFSWPLSQYLARHPRRHSEAHRPGDRARLCRQGISRPRRGKPAPRLHLRPKARGVRPHQTRAQTSLRHRGGDRPHEGRRSSRPLLSQRPRRRRRQCHPQRRRLQPSPPPRLAEDDFARRLSRPSPDPRHPTSRQIGFLTGDYLI